MNTRQGQTPATPAMTRRRFLKLAGLSGAVLAVPTLVAPRGEAFHATLTDTIVLPGPRRGTQGQRTNLGKRHGQS